MGEIFTLLWKYKTLIIIALMAITIAAEYGYINILKTQKANLVTEVENLNEKLKITKASIDRLQSNINDQNKAIEDFKTAADKNFNENKPKIDAANTTASGLNKQADDLLKKPQMKDTTACNAALQLINSELDNATK